MDRLDLRKRENADFAHKALNTYQIYKRSLEKEFIHLENIMLAEKDLMRLLAEVTYDGEDLEVLRKTNDIYHCDINKSSIIRLERMRDVVERGVGQDMGVKGSGLWLINGITSYFQNEANYKSDETKFDSIQNGNAAKTMQRAYQLITKN